MKRRKRENLCRTRRQTVVRDSFNENYYSGKKVRHFETPVKSQVKNQFEVHQKLSTKTGGGSLKK